MWISLSIAIISCIVLATVLIRKTSSLRGGTLPISGEELYPYIEPHVRRAVRATDKFLVHISRGFVALLLVGLKKFTPWFHRWSLSVEKRLLNIIAVIKGRGIIRERGAASSFISDLIQHKERSGKSRPIF